MTANEKTDRNEKLVAAAHEKPAPTWSELGARFGISAQMARKIVVRETGDNAPKPRSRTLFKCGASGCRKMFPHESGYIGRYCPKCRGKYRRGRAVDKLTTNVKCGWRECDVIMPVSISAYKRGRGRYCSRPHRDLANAERLRTRK